MTLRTRTLLMVTLLLVVAVLATTTALALTARQALLAQTEADGLLIAQLLARSAGFAEQVPQEVEEAIGEQMVVEATIAAHLVGIAEAAGLSPDAISDHLRAITDSTVLDEFWITDETGHAYLRNIEEIDFTFSPDPAAQPQAHVFWALLLRTGEAVAIVQEARVREVDDQVFKYAGVPGVDRPRIVQVGYQAAFLEDLRQQVGLTRLVDELLAGGNVIAIQVVDSAFTTLAYSAVPGADVAPQPGETDAAYLTTVLTEGRPVSYLDGPVLKVMAPITDALGRVTGATLITLPTDHVQDALQRQVAVAALVAAFVLAGGLAASLVLARRVTGPVARLTAAAAAVEAETFELGSLTDVAARRDELGRLARIFQQMARQVYAREERLRRQVQELRIEIDEVLKRQQVEAITETAYFQELQEKARTFKGKGQEQAD